MTDGVTVLSLSASLQHNTSTAADCVCQITFNRTLSWKFKKWCKFSSHIKVKLGKKKKNRNKFSLRLYY